MGGSISLRQALTEEYRSHRPMRPVDLLKLVYQNEFGCGHLIEDSHSALSRLVEEERNLTTVGRKGCDYSLIGNGLARLHLRAAARTGLDIKTLYRFFLLSGQERRGSESGFLQKTEELCSLCQNGYFSFSRGEVMRLVEEWEESGKRPFSHSELYRRAWQPAYRVVEQKYCDFLPLFAAIDMRLRQKERVILAIDGNCGAGKSTLAALLKEVYECAVIPADDFFLQMHQRTEERLREVGGNLDRERLLREVLEPLRRGENHVSYRPFDCSCGALEDAVTIPDGNLFVVEGSYSMHRHLAPMYDLSVFCGVNPREQLRRIRSRSGEEMAKRFEEVWIPMENAYFAGENIKEKCDLVFETE